MSSSSPHVNPPQWIVSRKNNGGTLGCCQNLEKKKGGYLKYLAPGEFRSLWSLNGVIYVTPIPISLPLVLTSRSCFHTACLIFCALYDSHVVLFLCRSHTPGRHASRPGLNMESMRLPVRKLSILRL